MILIAVCDDVPYHRQKILDDLTTIHLQETLQAMEYDSGEALLTAFKMDQLFDIVLLDVEMPGEDGISIAEKIRVIHPDVILIFISSHQNYMVPSLRVRTFDFLVKPVPVHLLEETLTRAVAYYHELHMTYNIVCNVQSIAIPVREIQYVEAQGHFLLVHAEESISAQAQVLRCKGTMDSEEAKLLSRGFIRTHRSYLVNPANIREIDKLNMVMRCGDIVPISQRAKRRVMQEFQKYLARYGI